MRLLLPALLITVLATQSFGGGAKSTSAVRRQQKAVIMEAWAVTPDDEKAPRTEYWMLPDERGTKLKKTTSTNKAGLVVFSFLVTDHTNIPGRFDFALDLRAPGNLSFIRDSFQVYGLKLEKRT